MKRHHIVFVVGVAFVIAIPTGLLLYKSKRTETLDDYLVERGFARSACAAAIQEGASETTCYAGAIGKAPATLSFVTRIIPGYTPGASQVASESFVVVAMTLLDGTVRTWRYAEVWTASDARDRLSSIQNESAKSPL